MTQEQSQYDHNPQGPARTQPTGKQIAAVVAGNSLEFYDFVTYAYFAVYIGKTFFPSDNPTTSLLASLATFGAGFFTRPLGAIVIGRIADRIGRKPAMLLSFGLMGVAILGLAFTPAYSTIGITAPILVILFRLLQGFALGGELGPSTSYLFESASPNRRGLYVSLQYLGQSIAGLAAGLIGVYLANVMSEQALQDYGWRIAMLIGAAIIPLGLVLRRSLSETLDKADVEQARDQATRKATTRPYYKVAFLALVIMSAGTTVAYVMKYLTTYAIATIHMPASLAFGATVTGGIVGLCISPLAGWLSDKFGRKPVMIIPWTVLLLAVLPCFSMIAHYRNVWALYGAVAILVFLGNLGATSALAAITESLPKWVRSGSLSLVYALAVSVFGGTAQFNVAWLTSVTGSELAPAWYMMVGVTLGLIAMFKMKESAPVKIAQMQSRRNMESVPEHAA